MVTHPRTDLAKQCLTLNTDKCSCFYLATGYFLIKRIEFLYCSERNTIGIRNDSQNIKRIFYFSNARVTNSQQYLSLVVSCKYSLHYRRTAISICPQLQALRETNMVELLCGVYTVLRTLANK